MGTSLEELRVLRDAEGVADRIWQEIVGWEPFAKEVVGSQLARAADSIGANIAEAYGRFHFGEKLRFLYYARGSLYETKYWLNRTMARQLIAPELAQDYARELAGVARQINAFAHSLKSQRKSGSMAGRTIHESPAAYFAGAPDNEMEPIFSDIELDRLQSISQSPVSQSPVFRHPISNPDTQRNEQWIANNSSKF